jgi:hypothetical protein
MINRFRLLYSIKRSFFLKLSSSKLKARKFVSSATQTEQDLFLGLTMLNYLF